MTLKKEIKTRWIALLLIVLCAVSAVHFAFEQICKPKAYETINLFVTAKKCDNVKLRDAVEKGLSVKTTVSHNSVDDKYYKESLQTSGLLTADLLVLPQSLLPENSIDKEFAPLKTQELSSFGIDCENLSFYEKNGVNYAIKVYDAETQNNKLEQWAEFDGEESYYVVVNTARPNASPYSSGKVTTSNAFAALAVLLTS